MMSASQSLREARGRNLLSTRKPIKFGTWNVRTMYEGGRSANVAKEMRNYNLQLLGLCETRWTNSGETRLSTGETMIYSGHEEADAPHTQGVGIMMSKEAQQALIGWEPINSRILVAKFRTSNRRITLTFIMCYAPTNDADEEVKEEFYDRLQTVLDGRHEREMIILMGDFNAKIGWDNQGYTSVMGRHGLGTMNQNGQLLADFCAENNLVIGGSVFPHKEVHKTTWVSPDGNTENQIDHICVGTKFRRSLLDVRSKRGADAASDHHLVVGKLQLKLKRCTKTFSRVKYNIEKLKDQECVQQYRVTLRNRFEVLQDLDTEETVEGYWGKVKENWSTTCNEELGKRKKQHKPWITQKTLDKMDERKAVKNLLNNARTRATKARYEEEYRQKHQEVKQNVRTDKRSHIEDLATRAETAAGQRNMKELYDITRILAGKRRAPEKPIKDKNGATITTLEGQVERWKEHFSELLNRQEPEERADIAPADQLLPIPLHSPTREEIKKAIMSLKNGKSAGPDGIPAEALKSDLETSVDMLHPLFEQMWEKEEIPQDWKEGFIVKLPKKGDLGECKNYRGIMLLSVPGKVFNRILLDRMKAAVDSLLRDEQAGFRKERSCSDQIATLRIIIEQSLEWNSSLYVNFIDFEKAFDSLDRQSLWSLMEHYGIPGKYVAIIRNTYEGMACQVLHGGVTTDRFNIKTGVRQGCLLSPFLFLLAIDWIMKESTKDKRNGIQWTLLHQLDDLDFADDLALLSHTQQQMQDKTSTLEANASKIGLKINKEKTKVIRINAKSKEGIRLNSGDLEEVGTFTYLGSIVNDTGGAQEDIKSRIAKARTAFNLLNKVWRSTEIATKTKLRIFNSNVKSVLFYGAETWRTTKTTDRQIQSFINRCLRRIMRIWWPNHISNQDLWERTGQLPPPQQIKKRKWTWIGHTLRKDENNITRQALRWNPQGKRKRGRPRATWRRSLEQEMKESGHSWHTIVTEAQNRQRWRKIVSGLCSMPE